MSSDCATVIDLWTHWGQTTTVDRNNATACCSPVLVKEGQQRTGIPGVLCASDGIVTTIYWGRSNLRGSIPDWIENLKNLKHL
jgi:hypothetical protein